jgi:hypothetical protein
MSKSSVMIPARRVGRSLDALQRSLAAAAAGYHVKHCCLRESEAYRLASMVGDVAMWLDLNAQREGETLKFRVNEGSVTFVSVEPDDWMPLRSIEFPEGY